MQYFIIRVSNSLANQPIKRGVESDVAYQKFPNFPNKYFLA